MSNTRKSEIELHLRNEDKRYSLFTPTSVRSSVWKHFQVIKFLDTVENFARCNHCAEILSYAPRSGTGSLLRHRCVRVRANRTQKNLPATQSVSSFIRSMLPKKTKEDILKSQLEFISKDLKSLNTTEGDGFRKFAQALINIGAEYGKQNIDEILVSRPILVNSLIPAEYFNIKNQLEYILSNNHAAFSTDTWIDESSQRNFLALTAHYINDEFILDSSLLGTREFILPAKETSDRIHYFVMDILNEFQIKDKLNQSVIVTENSSEFVEAFRSYKRISCICHNLTIFMREVLENSTIKEIRELLEASKGLANFCENSELNSLLTISVKQNGTEEFSAIFDTLLSIFTMYNEIEQALMERNEWQEIAGINFHLLDRVLSFFRPFKECFEILSSQTSTVIAEYCFWYEKLQRCCIISPLDSEVISELKTSAKSILEQKMKPDIMHYAACFLNPLYKRLAFLSEEQRKQSRIAVKILMEDFKKQQERDIGILMQSEAGSIDINNVPSASNAHRDFCNDLNLHNGDCNGLNDIEIDNELYKYLEMETEHRNLLDFWKNTLDLPLLRTVARQILNIPASCTKCGRARFSLGDILEGGKAKISSESIDHLLFLHKNTGYTTVKNESNSMET
ncbi:transposable element Hobo transposase [Anastrepha ludens]|uniref:transposable element Hobo transposase n=1 Tax=Anastrepha ludens TaxID=28586 RepID=UPI0023B19362|nr:transposable element Hobo transposase [Anastrepha ludens]